MAVLFSNRIYAYISHNTHVEVRYVYWTFVGALFKDKARQVLQLYGPLAESCEVCEILLFLLVCMPAYVPTCPFLCDTS